MAEHISVSFTQTHGARPLAVMRSLSTHGRRKMARHCRAPFWILCLARVQLLHVLRHRVWKRGLVCATVESLGESSRQVHHMWRGWVQNSMSRRLVELERSELSTNVTLSAECMPHGLLCSTIYHCHRHRYPYPTAHLQSGLCSHDVRTARRR